MTSKRPLTLLFVLDERLSREKAQILMRNINGLRKLAQVELIKGSTTQEALLQKLKEKPYSAVIVPWYRYLNWTKVDASLGLTRQTGAIFAGYFADQLLPYELEEIEPGFQRTILLDFNNLAQHELAMILGSLIHEQNRGGVLPLLLKETPVFYESWFANQGMGFRLDQILRIPGIERPEWSRRISAIRLCVSALWSLIYEEGPGKSELSNAININIPNAYFQAAVDERCLALRICFTHKGWTPRDCVSAFWPNSKRPSGASQILLRHADLVRVHPLGDNGQIELTVLFLPSSVAENFNTEVHTLWIDPLSPSLLAEKPYSEAGPQQLRLRALPEIPQIDPQRQGLVEQQLKQRDRLLADAAAVIKRMKREMADRDEMIQELRSGGVGGGNRLEPPDAEALLIAFEDRLGDSRYRILALETELLEAEGSGSDLTLLETLRKKIEIQQAKEQAWLRTILATLQRYRQSAA